MIHVQTRIERPSIEVINRFRSHASATVYEASGRNGYIDSGIKPIASGMRLCGPAFTVQCPPGDNMMLHKALECAHPGDVLVVSVGGAERYGYFGDMMAVSAHAKKLGGLVIEGCVRDGSDIAQLGFPVFSTGLCIRGTGKGTLGLINYPTIVGGLLVQPGDLILGDDDGLVLVRHEECVAVLEKTVQRVAKEKEKALLLANGVSSVSINHFESIFEAAGLIEE